jgi:hypothetical protein
MERDLLSYIPASIAILTIMLYLAFFLRKKVLALFVLLLVNALNIAGALLFETATVGAGQLLSREMVYELWWIGGAFGLYYLYKRVFSK